MGSVITAVVCLAIFRITHQLTLQCEAPMCVSTVISCGDMHSYWTEMTNCFPSILSKPSSSLTPEIGDCSQLLSQTATKIPDAPVNMTYSLVSLNPQVFAVTVSWSMDDIEGVTGFKVEAYEGMAYQGRNVYEFLMSCSYLDDVTSSFTFEYPYLLQQGTYIRVQITSLPYNNTPVLNTNTVTFPGPASCLDILGSFPTACYSPRYGSPSVRVQPSRLFDKLGRLTGEMKVNVTWSSGIPGSRYPAPSQYFVMVALSTVAISCQNKASTSCFITNETSVILKPLNASITYQVAIQSYTPCSNGPCSYPSKITLIRAPQLVPTQASVVP